jgi:hypothetical protein
LALGAGAGFWATGFCVPADAGADGFGSAASLCVRADNARAAVLSGFRSAFGTG